MHAVGRTGSTKAAIVGEALYLSPEEQQKQEPLKQKFDIAVRNYELSAGRPPVDAQCFVLSSSLVRPRASFRDTGAPAFKTGY